MKKTQNKVPMKCAKSDRDTLLGITICSNTGENPIDVPKRRANSRNETAGVSHNCKKGHLSEIRAFSGHVWTVKNLHTALLS
jgi:hypothetical protein